MTMTSLIGRTLKRHRIDSRILFVFLILALGAYVFLKLASEVLEGDTITFDRWILAALRDPLDPSVPVGPTWLQQAMIDMTALGSVSVLTLITAFATAYLLVKKKIGTAAFLVAAVGGGATVSTLLKNVFARPRPDLVGHLVEVHTMSFPSGHAMNSAVTYLTLGVLLARAEKDRAVRIYLLSVAISLTLAIGLSRIYLGVHWPTDVIAGWCVGAIWAVFASLLVRTLQRRHTIERPNGSR